MRLSLDMDVPLKVLLVSMRLAAILWVTPLFAIGRVPARVKVLAVLVFAAALTWTAPLSTASLAGIALPLGMLSELLVGALMAFGVHCAFGALQFGGRLLDLQIGFGVASLINPSTEEQEPMLGTLLLLAGVMTFYLVDGHHWFVRGLVQSYEWFPLGRLPTDLDLQVVVAQFGLMFTLGTVLVAPVIAVLLLIDAGLAMAAKTMPQLNVFLLSIPVKIAVGLLTLAACAPYVAWALGRILEAIFTYWRMLAD
jgi:flagellar biosynthesis protein FliR